MREFIINNKPTESRIYRIQSCLAKRGTNLQTLAEKYHYNDANKFLATYNETSMFQEGTAGEVFKYTFPETDLYLNDPAGVYAWMRDVRTPYTFGRSLITNWLIEDYAADLLSSPDISVVPAGTDKDRNLLSNVKTSSAPDYDVYYNGKHISVELQSQFGAYWGLGQNNSICFRGNKLQNLVSKYAGCYFLALDWYNDAYCIWEVKPNILDYATYTADNYGGKGTYNVPVDAFIWYKGITSNNLYATLNNM